MERAACLARRARRRAERAMVAGAAVKCVERAARGPALARLVRRVDEGALVASLTLRGALPVAEGAAQGAERNQPRLAQTARQAAKKHPAVLAGLMRDGRTRTQVLNDAAGGGWRVFSNPVELKSCFEAALLVQARRRELIRAARSAGTAHSECELLRRHSGHVRQIGPNLAKRAGRRIAARSSYWRSDSTRSQRRTAHRLV